MPYVDVGSDAALYVASRAEQRETEQPRQVPPVSGHIIDVLTLTRHCHYLVSGKTDANGNAMLTKKKKMNFKDTRPP